jgi:hypothetical protein
MSLLMMTVNVSANKVGETTVQNRIRKNRDKCITGAP